MTQLGLTRYFRPKTGAEGENIACDHLKTLGYKILHRNYRKRFGEIDIIAQHQDVLCFVEVKTRRSVRFGSGLEAVDNRKQKRISRAALDYITRNNLHHLPARFDVVSIFLRQHESPEIQLLQNAFELVDL